MYDDKGGMFVGMWDFAENDEVVEYPDIPFRALSGLSGILIGIVVVSLWLG